MRTVIVNSIGREFDKQDVFFRAFQETDVFWATAELEELGQCAEYLAAAFQRMTVHRDYHMIILVDSDRFDESEYSDARDGLKKLLNAYFNFHLLTPLNQMKALPAGVTYLFYCRKTVNEDYSDINPIGKLLRLDSIKGIKDPGKLKLNISCKSGEPLDLSGLFETALQQHARSRWMQRGKCQEDKEASNIGHTVTDYNDGLMLETEQTEETDDQIWSDCLEQLVHNLNHRVKELQEYRPADNTVPVIKPQFIEYCSDNTELAEVVIQINLAGLAYQISEIEDGSPNTIDLSSFKQYTKSELEELFGRGLDTIRENQMLKPRYYSLEGPNEGQFDVKKLSLDIRNALSEKAGGLLGVKEALEDIGKPLNAASRNDKNTPFSFVLISKARKAFYNVLGEIKDNYNHDRILEEQKTILDICAQKYKEWRLKNIKNEPVLNRLEAEGSPRPEYKTNSQETLSKAQAESISGALLSLSDYEDIREEEEEITSRFQQEAVLWTPVTGEGDIKSFRKFAVVLAVIAVLIMLVPYLSVVVGTTGLKIPKVLMFLLTGLGMAAVYCISVLKWSNKVCRKINGYTRELKELLDLSREKRRESVKNVLKAYGETLPKCLIERIIADCRSRNDQENTKIEQQWQQHINYLNSAENELIELQTALSLKDCHVGDKKDLPSINPSKPPYDKSNQKAYMFFIK